MSKKKLTIFMTLLCVVLLAVCAVLYVSEDRQGPEIRIPDGSVAYVQGDDTEVLLNGVTAADARDGDVSDTLRVVQVTDMSSLNYVVVTYVAKDRSNNITKTDRWINLTDGTTSEAPAENLTADLEEQSEDALSQILANVETEEAATTAETDETTDGGDGAQTNTEAGNGTSDVPSSEAEGTEAQTQESQSESSQTTESEELVSTGSPIIRITTDELHLEVGESFDYMSYVQSCVDDKDTMDELYSRIVVNGEDANGNYVGAGIIDTSRVTSYDLNFYVFDTDGNMSNVETMHVTVGN